MELGACCRAGIRNVLAPRGETALTEDLGDRWHASGDAFKSLLITIRCGDSPEQASRVRVRGRGAHELGWRGFHQSAGIHDQHPGARGECQPEVVGDEQQAHAAVLLDTPQQREDLALSGGIECRRRLIGHEQARIAGQHAGEGHPLQHPARQLERIALGHRRSIDPYLG